MKVGLLCKSCKKDLPWLAYAVRSFEKNWRSPWTETRWTIVLDNDCRGLAAVHDITRSGHIEVLYTEPWPDRYAHAMAIKACADRILGTELVFLFDSDMMLVRPTTLEDLLVEVKPRLQYARWDSAYDSETRGVARQVWGQASIRSTGIPLTRDWLASPVWLFWGSTLAGARYLVEKEHRLPFWAAVYSSTIYHPSRFLEHPHTFCDIENIGLYGSLAEADRYVIEEFDPNQPLPIVQHWSYSDFGSVEKTLQKILS